MRTTYFWVIVGLTSIGVIAPAAAADPESSVNSLLSSGYEVKAANPLSAAATKELWTDPNLAPQIIITLQKGNSVAVCNMAIANWMNLNPTTLASTDRCNMH